MKRLVLSVLVLGSTLGSVAMAAQTHLCGRNPDSVLCRSTPAPAPIEVVPGHRHHHYRH